MTGPDQGWQQGQQYGYVDGTSADGAVSDLARRVSDLEATALERKLSELDCPIEIEVRQPCNLKKVVWEDIILTDEKAIACYLRVVEGGFFWRFGKHVSVDGYCAAIRVHSWRWTFADVEGETVEAAIRLCFERACDVFPGLRSISYDRTVKQVTVV